MLIRLTDMEIAHTYVWYNNNTVMRVGTTLVVVPPGRPQQIGNRYIIHEYGVSDVVADIAVDYDMTSMIVPTVLFDKMPMYIDQFGLLRVITPETLAVKYYKTHQWSPRFMFHRTRRYTRYGGIFAQDNRLAPTYNASHLPRNVSYSPDGYTTSVGARHYAWFNGKVSALLEFRMMVLYGETPMGLRGVGATRHYAA